MSANISNPEQQNDMVSFRFAINLLAILATLVLGGGMFLLTLIWMPTLFQSLFSADGHAAWDISRATAIVGYLLMWFSIVWGLLITNKMSQYVGVLAVADMHEFFSLLGLTFAFLHVAVLLGDQFIKYTPFQLLVPFASVNYQQAWVGIGQLAFYLLIPVTFTFYIRKWIGYAAFRWIHFGSFLTYSMVTIHSLLAGSDTKNPAVFLMYAGTGAVVFFLTAYRIVMMGAGNRAKA